MAALAEEWKSPLANLPSDDRAELAGFLLESLPHEDANIKDDAWEGELNRRLEAIESGTVMPIPADEVLAELRQEFP